MWLLRCREKFLFITNSRCSFDNWQCDSGNKKFWKKILQMVIFWNYSGIQIIKNDYFKSLLEISKAPSHLPFLRLLQYKS
jgi:hypothetical protein